MKVFISALESSEKNIIDKMIHEGKNLRFILTSYYYLRKNIGLLNKFMKIADEILIDSGAHSFQRGVKVDWYEYTQEYAEFIKKYDNDKIIGFFEMDIDPAGYPLSLVEDLRRILEKVSDKIIPVWHKERGIDEYKNMCRSYSGKIIAISGYKNKDIKDNQYLMFLKYAKKYNCKVHCLGMTRIPLLNKVPFDYVDSSTWKQAGNYGEIRRFRAGKLITTKLKGFKTTELDEINLQEFLKMQSYYYNKWRNVY